MSYLHCPTCACAYNVAREPACPRCGIRAGAPADPTDDIVAAVEQLARAMARATPIDLITAQSRLDHQTAQLALPAPGKPVGPSPALLRAVRAALEPAPAPAPKSKLATLIERIAPELARLRLPEKTGQRSRAQAMFLFAKSQLTKVHQASMNFGRALR